MAATDSTGRGRVVVVTGASGGIGEAIAREASARGFRVVLVARRGDRLRAIADDLHRLGGESLVVEADLADPAAPGEVVGATLGRFGRVDALVNNAGVGLPGLFGESSGAGIDRQVRVNLLAPMLMAREALGALVDSGGVVINVGSAIRHVPNPAIGAYGATKAGLRYWSDALRRELRDLGVRVCLVEPGPVRSGFFEAIDVAPARSVLDYNPLTQPPPGALTGRADVLARRVVGLVDRPRRLLSYPGYAVWPFRAIGALFAAWPWLGDVAIASIIHRFDPSRRRRARARPGRFGGGRMPPRSGRVADYLGLIRFSHTLFALPFALLGGALAARAPDGWRGRGRDWLGILLCMVAARSAAMAFNRWADRRIDAENPRTAGRHIPAGLLSAGAVAAFTAASVGLFLGSTLLFLPNPWPLRLSVPVLLWLLGYSYAKRFTSLAHAWLGVALGLSPMAAWIAIRGDLAWPPALLGLAVVLWVTGFDILYACQDAEFDRRAGLRSIPARLGVPGALRVAAACHLAMVPALVGLGLSDAPPLGPIYFAGVAAVAVLLAYEHAIVRPDDLSRVNVAFFRVNVGISMGLLAVGLIDLIA